MLKYCKFFKSSTQEPAQVCNHFATCLTGGRDLKDNDLHRTVAAAGHHVAYPHLHFMYSHRDTAFVTSFACRLPKAPSFFP